VSNTSGIEGYVKTLAHGEIPVSEAVRLFEVSKIINRFDQWAVTEYGLECLAHQYSIPIDRLGEQDWVLLMRDKRWVNVENFETALNAAKRYFKIEPPAPIPLSVNPAGSDPLVDYFTARKIKHSLISLHETYRAIVAYVPDNLPRPRSAPEVFSVKEDGVLGPAYSAFAYGIDGFLTVTDTLHLLNDQRLYERLLDLSYKQFTNWLNQVLEDAYKNKGII
jgi:hypothetical protein